MRICQMESYHQATGADQEASGRKWAKVSLRAHINAKCRDCIYDPKSGAGTWREQVAQCSVISCPLWPVRPAPNSGSHADPPRDPARLPQGWGSRPAKWTNSPDREDECS